MILIDDRGTQDPYLHIAIEDYIVRNIDTTDTDYVLLYINDPCVVVGKNQSIYKEVNFNYLRNAENAVVRRISGGGTVYHDTGNLCFSFLSKFEDTKVNNYRYFNQPIVEALQAVGIDATFSPRNDILWKDKKISGNAQFTDRKNILSHGTLLVNTDTEKLRGALAPNAFEVQSKAVSSVRSAVMNISQGSERFQTAAQLREYLFSALPITATYTFTQQQWQEIIASAQTKYSSTAWIYGRNPATHIVKPELILEIENGLITSIEVLDANYEWLQTIVGVGYNYTAVLAAMAMAQIDRDKLAAMAQIVF